MDELGSVYRGAQESLCGPEGCQRAWRGTAYDFGFPHLHCADVIGSASRNFARDQHLVEVSVALNWSRHHEQGPGKPGYVTEPIPFEIDSRVISGGGPFDERKRWASLWSSATDIRSIRWEVTAIAVGQVL